MLKPTRFKNVDHTLSFLFVQWGRGAACACKVLKKTQPGRKIYLKFDQCRLSYLKHMYRIHLTLD